MRGEKDLMGKQSGIRVLLSYADLIFISVEGGVKAITAKVSEI
jgi:hypothetical protein